MDARKERRGRKGGTANAGEFFRHAEKYKWYTASSIQMYFESKGKCYTYQAARAVFDALRRSKCYPSIEKLGAKGKRGHPRPMIMFIIPKPEKTGIPIGLSDICSMRVNDYLTSFLLTKSFHMEKMRRRMVYKKSDKNLHNIIELQRDNKPIWFDGIDYFIAAWEEAGNEITIMFEQIDNEHNEQKLTTCV